MSRRRNKPGHRADATGRTIGVRYVRLTHWLLDSSAWQALAPDGVKVLIDVWKRHNGINNGEISYAVREAEAIGVSKDRAARAFVDLVDKGFLKVRGDSAFTMKGTTARTWELTAEPCKDRPATKEFMVWRPIEKPAPKPAKIISRSHQHDTASHQRDAKAPSGAE